MRKVKGNRGFTLLEVLIAISLLSVGVLAIAGLAGTAVRSSGYSQAMTQANNLAQDRIEALMSVDFNNLHLTDTTAARTDLRRICSGSGTDYTCTPTTTTLNLGSKVFDWSYDVKLIDLDGVGATQAGRLLKKLTVTVTWTDPLWHTTRSLSVVTMRSRG